MKRKNVRSGIRTHAGRTRLRPERSALDRSAILTFSEKCYFTLLTNVTVFYFVDYPDISITINYNYCVK